MLLYAIRLCAVPAAECLFLLPDYFFKSPPKQLASAVRTRRQGRRNCPLHELRRLSEKLPAKKPAFRSQCIFFPFPDILPPNKAMCSKALEKRVDMACAHPPAELQFKVLENLIPVFLSCNKHEQYRELNYVCNFNLLHKTR